MQRARLPILPPPSMTTEQFRSLMAVDKKVGVGKMVVAVGEVERDWAVGKGDWGIENGGGGRGTCR